MDAEPVGGLAPAAAGVEQRRERLEQPRVVGSGAENAGDECLQGGPGRLSSSSSEPRSW